MSKTEAKKVSKIKQTKNMLLNEAKKKNYNKVKGNFWNFIQSHTHTLANACV